MPGQAKTVSVTTAKAISRAELAGRVTVTIGIMMFLQHVHARTMRALRQALGPGEAARSPAAPPRACRHRVRRISSASLSSASVMAGSSRCRSPSTVKSDTGNAEAASTVGPRPVDGSQPSCDGEHQDQHQADPESRQREAEDRARHDRRVPPGRRVAARRSTPSGMPIRTARTPAPPAPARASPACARAISFRADSLCDEGAAEVAVQRVPDEQAERLDNGGSAETEGAPPPRRSSFGSAFRIGRGDVDGVARRIDRQEHDRRHHGDEDDQGLSEPPDEIDEHGASCARQPPLRRPGKRRRGRLDLERERVLVDTRGTSPSPLRNAQGVTSKCSGMMPTSSCTIRAACCSSASRALSSIVASALRTTSSMALLE